MYNIFGSFVKSVTGVYNQINSATLTGAIDIVVVKQEDGAFIGSPFHVRFGKLGVLSSWEKVVEIAINDEEVDLQMKLGQAGEAFFVEKVKSQIEDVPYNLATSPIPSATFLTDDQFNFKDDNFRAANNESPPKIIEEDLSSTSLPISRTYSAPISIRSSHLQPNDNVPLLQRINEMQSEYPLSDMDSPISGSPSDEESLRRICSDTEVEGFNSPHEKKQKQPNMTWQWGMLPEETNSKQKSISKSPRGTLTDHPPKDKRQSKKHKRRNKSSISSEGLLLDDILRIEDKEVADLYFNRANLIEDENNEQQQQGESTPVPQTKEKNPFSFDKPSPIKQQPEDATVNEDKEMETRMEEDKADDTLPLGDEGEPKDIVLSLCGGLMSRRIAPEKFEEFVLSYEGFSKNPTGVLTDPKLVIKINESYYNWAVAGPYLMSFMTFDKALQPETLKMLKQRHMPRKRRGWFQWRAPIDQESSDEEGDDPEKILKDDQSMDKLLEVHHEGDIDSNTGGGSDTHVLISDEDYLDYKKTLRLTSDQWESLNLKAGKNKVTFTVTTRYQGQAKCHARIFLWSHEDKIVISDIDGTITKSDILGQILPAMGQDWSQTGVTGLFSKIKHNGYNFIYLSARAISQAQLTRDFLQNIKQGELTLPEGPVLLTPTSLLTAFKKEVIERKPEEFKISCMKDIQSLYAQISNPFFAGFGNRINDVYAYRAVGIPISRIFTINYKGEIKHEISKAFSTSYSELIGMVDQMFPPLATGRGVDPSQSSEFASFHYWRAPLVGLEDISKINEEEFEFP